MHRIVHVSFSVSDVLSDDPEKGMARGPSTNESIALNFSIDAMADPHTTAIARLSEALGVHQVAPVCDKAPNGWNCSRDAGHGGPCAASPAPEAPTLLNFGAALRRLRQGMKLRRSGWNGRGMWIALQVPDPNSKMTHPYVYIEYPKGHPAYPDGQRVPWLASQTDLLAEDWEVVS